MAANALTVSRMVFSLFLLVFSPYSAYFAVFYLLCGITDALDGFAARRLHTESERGAMLDSAADMLFAAVYAVRILPLLSVPLMILIWTAIIAAAKVAGIVLAHRKTHRVMPAHSFGNRLTGVLLFLLPMSVCAVDVKYAAALVCAVASVTAGAEICAALGGKNT